MLLFHTLLTLWWRRFVSRPCYLTSGTTQSTPCLDLHDRKADGSLRLCIDYRGLNEVTREDAYPLPRANDTLDELNDANVYTHHDLAPCF
jgi:hypothetical protein